LQIRQIIIICSKKFAKQSYTSPHPEFLPRNIFHKNREIYILPMKGKKNPSKVNTSSRSHRKIQTRKDKNKAKHKNKKQKIAV
jgi:hypothetical protein